MADNEPLGSVTINERQQLKVRCKGGYIVAEPFGDPGVYDEIVVLHERDDGKTLQLAIVGRTEDGDDCDWIYEVTPDWEPMHVYSYDGRDDDVAHEQYVKVDEQSNWY